MKLPRNLPEAEKPRNPDTGSELGLAIGLVIAAVILILVLFSNWGSNVLRLDG